LLTDDADTPGPIYGGADRSFREHQLVCNVGFHWQWHEAISLIGSAGRGVYAHRDTPVDFLSYLGVQFTF
jgi:hypothetical protein